MQFNITPRRIAIFLAELVGTAILGFVIGMASLQVTYTDGQQSQPVNQLLSIFLPIVIGATFAFLIYTFRGYTSAHFNPAISLSLFLKGEISLLRLISNWVAQFVGAFLGIELITLIFNSSKYSFAKYDSLLETLSANDLTTTSIAILEGIGAVLLVLGIFAMIRKANSTIGPIVAGSALAIAIFMIQPFTFAIINPAVAVALKLPAVYWFAPMLGGVVATLIIFLLDALSQDKILPKKAEAKKEDKKETKKK